jgi:hypothetical protein
MKLKSAHGCIAGSQSTAVFATGFLWQNVKTTVLWNLSTMLFV